MTPSCKMTITGGSTKPQVDLWLLGPGLGSEVPFEVMAVF